MTPKVRGRLAPVLIALLVLAACGGGGDDDTEDTGADDVSDSADSDSGESAPPDAPPTIIGAPIEEGPKAPFTGLSAEEDLLSEPAIVVKVDNNNEESTEALIGLDSADLVIEERIEDRATRFAAIFHSELPEEVGPVRSGRSSDLDLLSNLGTPILVFSGANIGVLGQLRELAAEGRVVLVADDASGQYHVRSTDFAAPYNLFADPLLVRADFRDQADPAQGIVSFRSTDSGPRPSGTTGVGVTVTGRDSVSFVHDPARGYVRVQDGAVHVTREGAPLIATNVVIMETVYAPSRIAAGSVDAVTIGEGQATVLIGGQRWTGTWSRETRDDGYTFHTETGEEVLLEPGRTWLSLAPADSYEFVVDSEITDMVIPGDG